MCSWSSQWFRASGPSVWNLLIPVGFWWGWTDIFVARFMHACPASWIVSKYCVTVPGWRATLSLPFLNEVLLVIIMTLLNNSWFFCFPKESDIMRGKNRVLRVIHWWSSFFLLLGGVMELRIFSLTDAYFTKGAPIRWGLSLCYTPIYV